MALYAMPAATSRWPVPGPYHSPYENNSADHKLRDREREFFKLPRIRLRSESSGKPVEPVVEGDHRTATSNHHEARTIDATNMDRSRDGAVAPIEKPSLPSMSVLGQQSQQSSSPNGLPPVRTVPSQPLQPKPVMAEREVHAAPPIRLPAQPIAPQSVGHDPRSQAGAHHTATKHDPSDDIAIRLASIDRLQAQVGHNRATLEACTRDIGRLEGGIKQLQDDFRSTVEVVRQELHAAKQHINAQTQTGRIDDPALEVFSNTLSQLVSKTADVDILKVQFEVIKRRLQHLEEGSTSPTTAMPAFQAQLQNHQRAASLQRQAVASHGHALATHARLPSSEPRLLPSQPTARVPYTPEPAAHQASHQHDQQAGGGWVSVNTGAKRPLASNGDAAATPIGSPKRTKLAPMEARHYYPEQSAAAAPSHHYQRANANESVATQAYHTEAHGTYPDATQPSSFAPYTQDGGPDESWRPASQRAVSGPTMNATSPRGRGRGRGRGGRPRKSVPLEPHIIATPEWEKEGWTGSQIEADGFYRGGVVRRGSGGGPVSVMSPIQSMDPYGHTKRSRTKPVRNADGVLIRKDGRPDMRSQSSAANLRKVHAKKEEDRLAQGGVALPAGEDGTISVAESPASNDSHDVEPYNAEPFNTQERADHIMKQMFPKGVELERARLYGAQQYFPSDQSQAGTTASTPAQRAVSESEPAQSVEPEKARDDSPQQQDEVMKDAPAAVEETGSVEQVPEKDPAPQPSGRPTPPADTIEVASEPTISTATAQP